MIRCPSCGTDHNRKGQRYCSACHANYQRGYRKKLKAECDALKHERSMVRMIVRLNSGQELLLSDCDLLASIMSKLSPISEASLAQFLRSEIGNVSRETFWSAA